MIASLEDAGVVEEAGGHAAHAKAVHEAVRAGRAGALGNLASGNDDEAVEARWEADAPACALGCACEALYQEEWWEADAPACALGSASQALHHLTHHLTGSNAGAGATRRWTAVVLAGVPAALVKAAHEPVPVHHPGAQKWACRAIANIAAGNDQAGEARRTVLVQALAPAALVAAVHEAIRAAPRAGWSALEWACEALANLAAGDDQALEARRTELVQAGAPAALAKAAHEVCTTLANLAARDDQAESLCALEWACTALANLAAGDDQAGEARRTALVQAGALAALVVAAHAARAGHASALARSILGIVVRLLTDFALAHGDDETKAAAMVQVGAHEVIMTETEDPVRRECLVALAGPAGVEPDEPIERIMYRIRVKRESYWVERHGRTLSVAATAFRDNKIPLVILAKACVLANGDELVHGWKQGFWRAVGGRLLESAERALLEALNTTPVLAGPDGGAAPQSRRPNVTID
jgi:hypothetical protein